MNRRAFIATLGGFVVERKVAVIAAFGTPATD
jgi:hypothetical protein